jgi:hypothetical protein
MLFFFLNFARVCNCMQLVFVFALITIQFVSGVARETNGGY